jgi:glycosyltransferase involved in cell wall biosynthesis
MRVVMVDPGAYTPFHDDALCRALVAEGCEVELVTAPFVYHPWPAPVGYARREPFAGGSGGGPGLRGGGAPYGRSAWTRGGRRLRRALSYPLAWGSLARDLARKPPDVVHLQWSLLPAVERRALRRLRAAGVRVVQTVHNPRPHGGERSLWSPWPLAPAGRGLFDEADALVALSEASGRTLLADHPQLRETLRVIPPGLPAAPLGGPLGGPVARAEARARLGLEGSAPTALFLGLIRAYKGLDLLLEAFREVLRPVPDARLVVAGLPRISFRPFARQIERLGLGERVTTDLRYLPQSAMEDYLAAADLVVLPYRDASQSAVLAAALALDRPVVASSAGGMPEMLEQTADSMLVTPGDVPALARAMSRLLGARESAAELGRRAGSAARERFTWPRAAASTVQLYRELEARSRPA